MIAIHCLLSDHLPYFPGCRKLPHFSEEILGNPCCIHLGGIPILNIVQERSMSYALKNMEI
jgi:hypothetical protein